MKRFAIYGASGCGRGVMPLARQQLERSGDSDWDLVFLDDGIHAHELNGHHVMPYAQWISEPAESRHVSIAISNSTVRSRLAKQCLIDMVSFFEVRASNMVELDEVAIGEGAVLCPFVTLTSNIRIGKHFHANLYSYVEHDCVIGDFVTFAPGVHCNGNVHIEDHAYIGTGAVLKQGKPGEPLVIGRGAVVGMGAVVTKNVAPGTTVIGNPARVMEPCRK
ncbi:MAG TPA: acetyltransferase [Burkholderiaceae bacterium]|nr:acetyltransferase [Burkholderiaceae bacterium]